MDTSSCLWIERTEAKNQLTGKKHEKKGAAEKKKW